MRLELIPCDGAENTRQHKSERTQVAMATEILREPAHQAKRQQKAEIDE